MKFTNKYFFSIISAASILVSYSPIIFVQSEELLIQLTSEDGIFETFGALSFLFSSFIFFATYRKNKNRITLLLAFILILGFFEEISWGQRIFDVKTPQFISEINRQNEINIHNISIFHGKNADGSRKPFWALMLNIDRLFSIFWFLFCFVMPLLSKYSLRSRKILNHFKLPIAPISIGVFFLLNYILAKIIIFYANSNMQHSVVEIKEANLAFLFLLLGIWFLKHDDLRHKDPNNSI